MNDRGPFQGKFISFEGGDGVGKSTQSQRLSQRLERCGIEVVRTREPGGCPFSERLRHLLVSGSPETMDAKTELLLMTAARIEHVRQLIQPALKQGKWVVCDRFFDSTLAYQGFGRGMERSFIEMLHGWALGGWVPDLTILLTMDPQDGTKRSREKWGLLNGQGAEVRFEMEEAAFHQRVHEGFITLARNDPRRFRVIDAMSSEEIVMEAVWKAVKGVFPEVA
ncbi:MAG: dTMP kinase [Magnetococcus sp. THC-1_WYH]